MCKEAHGLMVLAGRADRPQWSGRCLGCRLGPSLLHPLSAQHLGWGKYDPRLDPGLGQDTGLELEGAPSESVLAIGKDYPPEKGYYNGEVGLIPLGDKWESCSWAVPDLTEVNGAHGA